MTTRNVLILSGRFGKGHDTVAEATAAALAPLDVDCRILDAIALLGPSGGAAGDRIFRTLLSMPAVYDSLHFSQLRTGGRLARWMDRKAVNAMYPRFLEEVRRFPPDLIVSVFATGAGAAARFKIEHPGTVTAVFITDSYAHRLWVHDATDIFIVTSRLGACSVKGLRPRARVEVVTAPTRPEFYAAPARSDARLALGVPEDARCVLLMSGAWGVGPVADSARELAGTGIWVLVVAGSNETLERIGALHGAYVLHAFEFVDRVVQGRVHIAPAAPCAQRAECLEGIRQVLFLVPAVEIALQRGIRDLGAHNEKGGHLVLRA